MEKVCGGKREQAFPIAMDKPMVSIVIVTRNVEADLPACLQSIRLQSYQNLQIIIFDGDSTDGTIEIIRKNENIISYWQSEPDKGIYDAMNNVVKKAAGQWIYFLGADDVLLPGFSEMASRLVNPSAIYYGDCLTDTSLKLGGVFSAYRLTKMNVCHHAVLYPRAVFSKYHYPVQYPVYADHALNIQCWGDRSFSRSYIPIEIARFKTTGFSSTTKDELFKKEKGSWIKKYLGAFIYFRYRLKKWKESKKEGSRFY